MDKLLAFLKTVINKYDSFQVKLVELLQSISDIIDNYTTSITSETINSTTINSTTVNSDIVSTDTIDEKTTNNGVTIDGVKMKDAILYQGGNDSLTATGTDKNSALQLLNVFNEFTNVDLGTGCILLNVTGSIMVFISNNGLNDLTIYAPDTMSIDKSTSMTLPVGKKCICVQVESGIWYSLIGA